MKKINSTDDDKILLKNVVEGVSSGKETINDSNNVKRQNIK